MVIRVLYLIPLFPLITGTLTYKEGRNAELNPKRSKTNYGSGNIVTFR
jgi:hypothetical protein